MLILTNTLEGTKVSLLPPYKVNDSLILASYDTIVHNITNPTNPIITTGIFFGRDGRWIETDEGKYFLHYSEDKNVVRLFQ